jgi:hypothetical protein
MTAYKHCEYCNRTIGYLYLSRQRFCSVECGNKWFALERRQAIQWFRAEGIAVKVPRFAACCEQPEEVKHEAAE